MRETTRIVYLLRRRIKGESTEEEQVELDRWSASHPEYRRLLQEAVEPASLLRELAAIDNAYGGDKQSSMKRMYARIRNAIPAENTARPHRTCITKWFAYAAAAVLFAVAGFALWKTSFVDGQIQPSVVDIAPGGSKAVLTFSDGRRVTLREDQDVILLQDGHIHYADGQRLLMDDHFLPISAAAPSMSLFVPKGGTYQVVLSDGTRVYLNAASILRYPRQFGEGDRCVELEGEGYFDVSQLQNAGKKSRFVVRSRYQEIEVLGTEFNLSAYDAQQEAVTTVLKGRVAVTPNAASSEKILLTPGDQSTVTSASCSIAQVETAQYIAWKEGLFYFQNTSFVEMMEEIANWYNIEVVYKDRVPDLTFSGKMSRKLSLKTVLELLNVPEINVDLVGKTLVVN